MLGREMFGPEFVQVPTELGGYLEDLNQGGRPAVFEPERISNRPPAPKGDRAYRATAASLVDYPPGDYGSLDLLSRFPKGQLDAIVMQGPEAAAAVDFATRNGRDEIKFIVGDYPADVRQLIYDGKIFGTVDQDPYPQAYNAMRMAWLHFNNKDADIPKPNFLELPLVTKENAKETPPAWGC